LNLPFREGAFTHVNSFVTLPWLPIRRALRQIQRVLEPGGRLTLTVEGIGYWVQNWRATRGFGRARLGRIREWLGAWLMRNGLDWQLIPGLAGRLAGHTAFDTATIARIVRGEGFDVEDCQILTEAAGRPRPIGLTATKRPDPR
jgi:SAM-dependent methyltransferase